MHKRYYHSHHRHRRRRHGSTACIAEKTKVVFLLFVPNTILYHDPVAIFPPRNGSGGSCTPSSRLMLDRAGPTANCTGGSCPRDRRGCFMASSSLRRFVRLGGDWCGATNGLMQGESQASCRSPLVGGVWCPSAPACCCFCGIPGRMLAALLWRQDVLGVAFSSLQAEEPSISNRAAAAA